LCIDYVCVLCIVYLLMFVYGSVYRLLLCLIIDCRCCCFVFGCNVYCVWGIVYYALIIDYGLLLCTVVHGLN